MQEDPTPMQLNNMLDGIEWVRAFRVNPKMCCERCAFGRGKHAEFCTADADMAKAMSTLAAGRRKLHRDYDAVFRGGAI